MCLEQLACVRLLAVLHGDQWTSMAQAGAIPALVSLLRADPAGEAGARSVHVISGMAAHSSYLRKQLLQCSALPLLCESEQQPTAHAQLRSTVELLQLHEHCMAIADPEAQACALLLSDNESMQLDAVRTLTIRRNPSSQQGVDWTGAVERLIHFLSRSDDCRLQVTHMTSCHTSGRSL